MTALPPNPPTGYGKMYAAALAGAATTIVVWAIDQFLKTPMPPEIVAAVQTLVTGLAVWLAPHSSN